MREFIITNWLTILLFLALVIVSIFFIITRRWDKLRELAYKLMLSAERWYEDNQGPDKFEEVFKKVYKKIPAWLKYFVPPESVKEKLQRWYTLAKDCLDDGQVNQSNQ